MPNKALHQTPFPLRSKDAGELSELIREIMVLMDSQWIGQGNWNRGKKDQMITFGNWRDKVSKEIGISQTKIQKLLYIYQNQPELIKYIDDDRMTIHSDWIETRRQMNTISLSERMSNRQHRRKVCEWKNEKSITPPLKQTTPKNTSKSKTHIYRPYPPFLVKHPRIVVYIGFSYNHQ